MAKKMSATPMMSKNMGSKGMAKTSMPSKSAAPKTTRPVPLPMALKTSMAIDPSMPPIPAAKSPMAAKPKVMGPKGKKGM